MCSITSNGVEIAWILCLDTDGMKHVEKPKIYLQYDTKMKRYRTEGCLSAEKSEVSEIIQKSTSDFKQHLI